MPSEFPKAFIQSPPRIPFRNPLDVMDDPFGDFTSGEVRGMNQDYLADERLREAGHNE